MNETNDTTDAPSVTTPGPVFMIETRPYISRVRKKTQTEALTTTLRIASTAFDAIPNLCIRDASFREEVVQHATNRRLPQMVEEINNAVDPVSQVPVNKPLRFDKAILPEGLVALDETQAVAIQAYTAVLA